MTRSHKLSIVALVLALTLAACGGSSKKADPAADLATAKAAVLTAADLPGYKGVPHTADSKIPAKLKSDFATCMGVSTTIFDDTPGAQKADSLDFSKGANDEQQVSDTVEIDPKKATIDEGWQQISKPEAAPCLGKLFDGVFKESAGATPGVVFAKAVVTPFDVGIGDRSVGFAVNLSATVPHAGEIKFSADLIYVPRDRAGLEFDFFNTGTPTDHAFETGLVQKVYDRVGDNAK